MIGVAGESAQRSGGEGCGPCRPVAGHRGGEEGAVESRGQIDALRCQEGKHRIRRLHHFHRSHTRVRLFFVFFGLAYAESHLFQTCVFASWRGVTF